MSHKVHYIAHIILFCEIKMSSISKKLSIIDKLLQFIKLTPRKRGQLCLRRIITVS